MLSFVPNLLNLALILPADVLSNILNPSLDHSFMLTRLTIRLTPGPGFLDFLKRQEHIEDIVFKEYMPPAPQRRMLDLRTFINLGPDALPLLKRADGFFMFVRRLGLSRSLDAAYLRGPIPLLMLAATADKFSSASVPLTSLGVDLEIRRWSLKRDVRGALVALERLGGSLVDLKLRLFIRGEDHTSEIVELLRSSYTPPHGLDEIRELLSPFTALRKFELTSSQGTGPPTNCLTAPELSQFDLWRTSCPTLKRVSIFDVVLSDE